MAAVETVAELKRRGEHSLLIARGGIEEHGRDVLTQARRLGLAVTERQQAETGPRGLLETLEGVGDADIVSLTSPLSPPACRLLFSGCLAVLADSAHEPFGLVGLETMAVRGVACTGGTGEDYVEPGRNALVLRDGDPRAMTCLLSHVRRWPEATWALADRASRTAREYAWDRVIDGRLLPVAEAAA